MRPRASSTDGSWYRVPDTLVKITSDGHVRRVVMVYESMACVRVDLDVVVHAYSSAVRARSSRAAALAPIGDRSLPP